MSDSYYRSFPWPETGDKLFKSGNNLDDNSCLEFTREQWNLYCDGFLKGAESLAAEAVAGRGNQDTLVIPLLYLYRHYMELRLKDHLRLSQFLLDEQINIPHKHDLLSLWKIVRKNLEKIETEGDRSPLNIVEKHIKDFSEIDQRSLTFRYPEDQDGKSTYHKHKVIDVRNLKSVMEKVSSFLDSVSTMLREYRSWKFEMQAEAQKDMMNWL